ncbi:MAG TPA: RES domain-containing protein [Acidobacteriota bacterium]|nr:RES domain-containing protein [Acidobacteriota bacterium]
MKPKLTVIDINFLQDFALALRHEADPGVVHEKLSWLLDHYDVINYDLSYDWPIWRARKCKTENGFGSVNELIYPPRHIVNAGRLNNAGEPMLYGALNKNTALEEIGAEGGEYVHIIGFRIKKGASIKCCIVGEIDSVYRSGRAMISEELGVQLNRLIQRMPYQAAMSFVFADAFLSSLLRDPSASKNDYLHSRTVRQLLFERKSDLEAICYLSVRMEGAMNIALKPEVADERLDLAGTSVIKIEKKFDYGLFDFSLVKNAKDIEQDRKIIWG